MARGIVRRSISDSQPPKKLIQRKIILPLTEKSLSDKHGVVSPKTINAALLRPGRFDCIIPVGELDAPGRGTILAHYLSKLNTGEFDVGQVVEMTSRYTPADIEYLFHQVAQFAFEKEYETGQDCRVSLDTFRGQPRPTTERKVTPYLGERAG